jgi:hypothetical protein
LLEDGVPAELIEILKGAYESTVTRVQTANSKTTEFDVESGIKQGCPLLPAPFNYIIDWIMMNSLCTHKEFVVGQREDNPITLTDLDM